MFWLDFFLLFIFSSFFLLGEGFLLPVYAVVVVDGAVVVAAAAAAAAALFPPLLILSFSPAFSPAAAADKNLKVTV